MENNKLIAEFMGFEEQTNPSKRWLNQFFDPKTGERHVYLFFSSSWDWLMPVVEKINMVDDYRFTVFIKSMDVEIYDNLNGRNIFESECDWQPDELKSSVYQAVVEFIKWHNSRKI